MTPCYTTTRYRSAEVTLMRGVTARGGHLTASSRRFTPGVPRTFLPGRSVGPRTTPAASPRRGARSAATFTDGSPNRAAVAESTGTHGPFLRRVRGRFDPGCSGRRRRPVFALTSVGYAAPVRGRGRPADAVAIVTHRPGRMPRGRTVRRCVRVHRHLTDLRRAFVDHLFLDDARRRSSNRGMDNYITARGPLDVQRYTSPRRQGRGRRRRAGRVSA